MFEIEEIEDDLYDAAYPRTTMTAAVGSAALGSSDVFDDDLVAGYGRASEMAVPIDVARGARGAIGVLTGFRDVIEDERR